MNFFKTISDLVGNTPLFLLNNFEKGSANIYAKLEFLNPTGSIKDRAALYMILDMEKRGLINKGDTIIEPTSGNTGVGLAAIGVSRGYKVVITMPDNMSAERIRMMRSYGAEVILTDGAKGMLGAIEKAEEISKTTGGIIAGQFTNPANPLAHFETTGPEIWSDTNGLVDILVSAIGTGGTITGTGEYLKSKNPKIQVFGVEPASSPYLTEGKKGAHKIQGIGAGFVPEILNRDILDGIITVTDEQAYSEGQKLAKDFGLFVGISSGAALSAAKKIALLPENKGKNIVVIFADSGSRYLSTEGYY